MTKTALITGGARRIGAAIAQVLHQAGYQVIIHYHHSHQQAQDLADMLNAKRAGSAKIIQADLQIVNDKQALAQFATDCLAMFGRLDVLVHNASSFYATDLQATHEILLSHWQDLMLTNAKAPLLLTQAFLSALQDTQGSIISLLDIHADRQPFVGYPIYNMAKAAHRMMVQSLALELSPKIRINGVAPGVNIFPDDDQNPELNSQTQAALTASVPLAGIGTPDDIAQTVLFLAGSPYITGQIIAVDGGRSLTIKGG
ncbi:pteridine reductase [Moraxella marmotae]|uniref:pteridine reductase n=1 Tax=Moraxella marmotae TaxID=3344520 RepID=UPI0035F40D50